jgi:PAS domain S-box-containing protein
VRGLVISSRDITERKEAQNRIFEQAALLNKAQDAIMVIDLNGLISFWNQSAEQLYGWTAAELLGKEDIKVLYDHDVSKRNEALEHALREGDWNGEIKNVTREGKPILVESRWSVVRDTDQEPKSILIINTDITERKKLEAHFLRAQRMESIGTLAGGIAHDLNNVLTPILMSLKLLRDLKGQAPLELLETLETSAHRGAAIVQQVLSFARGVEGEKALLQLKHPLTEVLKIARDVFPPSIQIHSTLPADLWPVNGDPTQLHQVFMNLFVNARDAMPNGGRLQLAAENVTLDENYARMQPESKPGRYVLVTVADTGSGIPQDLVHKIFEPFFTTKEIGTGTGLGLSTAVGIIRSHGGFISVYSEPGKGSNFKVYLPAAELSHDRDAKSPAEPELPGGKGETILVVDDEAAIREIIKVTLENHGYHVVIATDGAEAVGIFASNPRKFKAVIVDVMMPYMDGPAMIRAVQRLDPTVRFVTISGLMDQSRTAQLSELGEVAFLAKPFTTEQILSTLHQLLRAGS